jgi:LPXTG-motif cell wall-anchored protein
MSFQPGTQITNFAGDVIYGVPPFTTTFSGTLVDATTLQGIAGETVSLDIQQNNIWNPTGITAVTDANGFFIFAFNWTTAYPVGTYDFHAFFVGDTNHQASASNEIGINVVASLDTTEIYLNASPLSGVAPFTTTFNGRVDDLTTFNTDPIILGAVVSIEILLNGVWTPTGVTATPPFGDTLFHGTITWPDTLLAGNYQVSAFFPGDNTHAAARSASVTLTIGGSASGPSNNTALVVAGVAGATVIIGAGAYYYSKRKTKGG